MGKKIQILIVDDHPIFRAGLRLLFESKPNIKVVGEAKNGQEGLTLTQKLQPDLILMDLTMPDMGGIEATRAIIKACPDARILALTMHEDVAFFFQMLQAGALGYIVKGADPSELMSAIGTVSENKSYLFPSLAQALLDDYLRKLVSSEDKGNYSKLSDREKEVFTLIGEGNTSREIAELLFLSKNTVERHRTNIMDKLEMHTRGQLLKFAIRNNLVKPED